MNIKIIYKVVFISFVSFLYDENNRGNVKGNVKGNVFQEKKSNSFISFICIILAYNQSVSLVDTY